MKSYYALTKEKLPIKDRNGKFVFRKMDRTGLKEVCFLRKTVLEVLDEKKMKIHLKLKGNRKYYI